MANLIIGESQSGKTTFLKVLSKGRAHLKFSDINVCAVPKEDYRLIQLWKTFNSKSINFINMDFIDLPGNAKLSSLTPQFYERIQKSEILFYIIPLFREDLDIKNYTNNEQNEIILRDLEKIQKNLLEEKPLNEIELREDELKIISSWNFISIKPIFYVINVSNNQLEDSKFIEEIKNKLKNKIYFIFPAQLEEEIMELSEDEVKEYLSIYNLKDPIRNQVLDKIFEYNDLISFFTAGEKEARAWKLKKGSTALEAAGTIHSDIARGFIRAEVIRWDELVQIGDWKKAYQEGKVRIEKKDYIVQDGDVIYIRFHV